MEKVSYTSSPTTNGAELKPSTSKVMFTDYGSFLLILFSGISLFMGPGAVVVLIFSLPLLFGRINKIKNVFKKGVVIKGKLTERRFGRHWCTIKYGYEVNGQTYETKNWVRRYTINYAINDPIDVVYMPTKPKLASPVPFYMGQA